MVDMTTVERSSSDLAGVVEMAARAHGYDVVTVADEGEPVAVVMSPQEYDSLMETLDILSNPGELEDIEASRAEVARGELIDGPTALARFLPRPPENIDGDR